MLPPDEKVLKTYGSDENADIFKLSYSGTVFNTSAHATVCSVTTEADQHSVMWH
jgi:hypothetical protein